MAQRPFPLNTLLLWIINFFIDAHLNEVKLSHSMWSVELRSAELLCFTFLRNSGTLKGVNRPN